MSDSTSNLVSFVFNPDDKRPLPEIIADLADFSLAYHDLDDGKRVYAVQDWILGIAQTENPRVFWAEMKRRHPHIKSLCVKLPYKARNMKTYRLEFVDTTGLMSILKKMGNGTGIVNQIFEGTYTKQKTSGVVYLFSIEEMPGYYKIGKTKNVQKRLSSYNTVVPLTIKLEYAIEHIDYDLIEKKLHRMFDHKRVKGEWFLFNADEVKQVRALLSNFIGNVFDEMSQELGIDLVTGKPLLMDK